MACNSAVNGQIWLKLELIQALFPARMKKFQLKTRIDVNETLCPQQMLVHKGDKIKGVQRCHTYKIAVSKYQGRCEQRSEVFVKIKKKKNFFLGGWGGGGVRSGGCSGGGVTGWM